MAEGTEELGRLVDAEPRRAGAAEHRVRFVVPTCRCSLSSASARNASTAHLPEFIMADTHHGIRIVVADLWRAVGVGAVGHGGVLRFLEHGDPVLEPARVVALGDTALHRRRHW